MVSKIAAQGFTTLIVATNGAKMDISKKSVGFLCDGSLPDIA